MNKLSSPDVIVTTSRFATLAAQALLSRGRNRADAPSLLT